MNAFCASENLLAFIVFRSSQPRDSGAENSNLKRSSFVGSDHYASRFGDEESSMKTSKFTEAQIAFVLKQAAFAP
jgi:hypothetical protein